ncbi:hypothetical protein EMGBD4_03920 [Verrucomicrobiota bacterium]|nr:hypothetical protein EMGBD4_03920 [Verrucomicrobiota bacterium]
MAQLPFDPSKISRELARHYIPATEADIREMFAASGGGDFPGLYSHIADDVKFPTAPDLPAELAYPDLADAMEALSRKNHVATGFPRRRTPGLPPPMRLSGMSARSVTSRPPTRRTSLNGRKAR